MRAQRVWAAVFVGTLAACEQSPPTAQTEFAVPVVSQAFNSTSSTLNSGATLSGSEEVPPNDAQGHGVARFKLSDDGLSLEYRLNVASTENVTQADIHLAPVGVNGPIVAFLFAFFAGGVTQNGPLADGTITQANLIPGRTMPELVAAMRSGGAYVDVHTVVLPGGEIRGQIR